MAGPFDTNAGPTIRAMVIGDFNEDAVAPYTMDVPSSAQAGDWLIGMVANRKANSAAILNGPSPNWGVSAGAPNQANTGLSGSIGAGANMEFRTIVRAGGDPTSYDWTESAAPYERAFGLILPVGNSKGQVGSGSSLNVGSTANVVCPSVTPTDRGVIIHCAMMWGSASGWTNLNGDTYIIDGSTSQIAMLLSFDPTPAVAGQATGTKTLVADTSGIIQIGFTFVMGSVAGGGFGAIPLP